MNTKFLDTQPKINDDDLFHVESNLKIKIPVGVREHYLRFNGGRPVPNAFRAGEEIFIVNEFLPIKYGAKGTRLEDTYVDLVEGNDYFPQDFLPFANDAGGDCFCCSMSGDQAGNVYFYQSDYYDDPSRAIVYLAESMEAFLASLISDPDV